KEWQAFVAEHAVAPPYTAYSFVLLEKDGAYYHVALSDDQTRLVLHRFTAQPAWAKACEISLVPSEAAFSDSDTREVLTALDAALDGARGAYRNRACGSSWSGDWMAVTRLALRRALYRPWAVAAEDRESYGTWSNDIAGLELWAAEGIDEQRAYSAYRER